LTDRQKTVKLFMGWTLGLAVLLGWAAVGSGQRPPIPVVTYCGCTCWYSGAGGKTETKGVTFTSDKSCTVHNGRTCYCDDRTCFLEYKTGARYKGLVGNCKKVPPVIQREPSPKVPPGGVKPPAGTLQKSP
jgi:hypothetical protein